MLTYSPTHSFDNVITSCLGVYTDKEAAIEIAVKCEIAKNFMEINGEMTSVAFTYFTNAYQVDDVDLNVDFVHRWISTRDSWMSELSNKRRFGYRATIQEIELDRIPKSTEYLDVNELIWKYDGIVNEYRNWEEEE